MKIILNSIILCSLFNFVYLYQQFILDSDKVCSIVLNRRILRLGSENKSGLLIKNDDLFKYGKLPFECSFTVEGNDGISVVIQNMQFRVNRTKGYDESCIDYVQFSTSHRSALRDLNINVNQNNWSNQYCGRMDLADYGRLNIPSEDSKFNSTFEGIPIGRNTFVEPTGSVNVKVYIGPGLTEDDQLKLSILFTGYHPCKFDRGYYKQCGGPMCIWSEYFDDGFVNCPFVHCTEELLCDSDDSSDHKSIATGLGTKVLLGAVAGIFTMMFVLFLFFWTFHYCGFLCQPKPSRNLTELTAVPTQEDVIVTTSNVTTSNEDKDLPPSYDSLFPSTSPSPALLNSVSSR